MNRTLLNACGECTINCFVPIILKILLWSVYLILVMLNKSKWHAHFKFSAIQFTWSKLLIKIHILHDRQCRSRSVGFCRSQLIWIYTVCKGRAYPGSSGPGLRCSSANHSKVIPLLHFFVPTSNCKCASLFCHWLFFFQCLRKSVLHACSFSCVTSFISFISSYSHCL